MLLTHRPPSNAPHVFVLLTTGMEYIQSVRIYTLVQLVLLSIAVPLMGLGTSCLPLPLSPSCPYLTNIVAIHHSPEVDFM